MVCSVIIRPTADRFFPEQMLDGGSLAAVIVVLVLAMATGCIITCAVVVWKRISAKKNTIVLR